MIKIHASVFYEYNVCVGVGWWGLSGFLLRRCVWFVRVCRFAPVWCIGWFGYLSFSVYRWMSIDSFIYVWWVLDMYRYLGVSVPWPRCCLGGSIVTTRLYRRMCSAVRGYVAGCAYVDRGLSESVCVVGEREVADFLRGRFGAVDWRVVELFNRGEVLSDPRGDGSLQRVEDEE